MRVVFGSFMIVLAIVSIAVAADVIAERKANFKRNADSLKAIQAAIPQGDTATIAASAQRVADWSARMLDYFPEGSDEGDTKARAEIWFDFDVFTERAKDAENAALSLVALANNRANSGALAGGLKALADTCKACHQDFKD